MSDRLEYGAIVVKKPFADFGYLLPFLFFMEWH